MKLLKIVSMKDKILPYSQRIILGMANILDGFVMIFCFGILESSLALRLSMYYSCKRWREIQKRGNNHGRI